MKDILKGKKHIHFIGIGGSGMFPIAQILHGMGYYITGSDNNETDTLKLVREMGIPVTLGQKAENIDGADLIIHTAAIMNDNPELIAARKSESEVFERSEILGYITGLYENTICIGGTHGKTTVTSMLTKIFMDAGADPTAVIGGKLDSIGGNGRLGKSGTMICEACEFVDTFLKLHPGMSVVLNIDEDHMEYFKTMDNLINSFSKFCGLASKMVIVNGDDANSMRAVSKIQETKKLITAGLSDNNDYYAGNITYSGGLESRFDLFRRRPNNEHEKLCEINLFVPGRHNILNAVIACAAALESGIDAAAITKSLSGFRGAGRRFEFLGKFSGVTVADDYAHHPAEIEVTLKTAKELGYKRVWAVHQPFTYSRTARLLDDFAKALSIADRVVLSEIMGSREKNTFNIYSKDLACKIPGAVWFRSFDEIAAYVSENAAEGDLVITMGCGDIYKAAKQLLNTTK